jgi:hypothetical protein
MDAASFLGEKVIAAGREKSTYPKKTLAVA